MMRNFGFEDLRAPLGPYTSQLRCNSAIMMPGRKGAEVDRGGKIILPASALDHLTRLHIQFPMLFKLTNRSKNRTSHCGVLEFVAEEGRCYLPYWMMRNLLLDENDIVQIEYVNLPIARFAKFQPQSVDFLEISNPKAVLENALRSFATLTKDDVVLIHYNEKDYELRVLETQPGNAVSIIECDMDVDFAPPVGYVEPNIKGAHGNANKSQLNQTTTKIIPQIKYPVKKENKIPYAGEGYRLDGKVKKPDQNKSSSESNVTTLPSTNTNIDADNLPRGIPNYDYEIGTLTFNRNLSKLEEIKKRDQNENKSKPIQSNPSANTGIKLKHIGLHSTTDKKPK